MADNSPHPQDAPPQHRAAGSFDSQGGITPSSLAASRPSSDGKVPSSPVKLSKSVQAVLSVPKDTFVSDLYAFMDRIGQPITKMPSLGYQELDLHRLFHAVISRGGMDEVTRKQEWKLVYQDLEIPTMSTSASYNTRTNYKKYLYLYELDRCDWGEERPADAALPKFAVGDYVRIESSTYEGQVFYAQIAKYRYRNHTNMYYVHYNGWSMSHDEWMPEAVLGNLLPDEVANPGDLQNPSPTRSSKSNYIIYDPLVSSEKHSSIPAYALPAQGSAKTTPKPKRKKSSKDGAEKRRKDSLSDGFTDDFEVEIDAHATPSLGTVGTPHASPAAGAARLSKRRPQNGAPAKKGAIILGEMEHPVMDSKLIGYPKRHRDLPPALDYELGRPQQVYYHGGEWKHSTPRVRKFHLHSQPLLGSLPQLPFDATLLDGMLAAPTIDLPMVSASPAALQFKAVGSRLGPVKPDSRLTSEIRESIAEKESRLRALKKDLRRNQRLMELYYGKGRGSGGSLLTTSRPGRREHH